MSVPYVNWRTVNVDKYDPYSTINFDMSRLVPKYDLVPLAEVQNRINQIRQFIRSSDAFGALKFALQNIPYGADEKGKELYLCTVMEVLQSIRQSDMNTVLQKVRDEPDGTSLIDLLMKYIYRGMEHCSSQNLSNTSTSGHINPQGTGSYPPFRSRTPAGNLTENSGQMLSVLLSWHEKSFEFGGYGSIMRVLSDRRII